MYIPVILIRPYYPFVEKTGVDTYEFSGFICIPPVLSLLAVVAAGISAAAHAASSPRVAVVYRAITAARSNTRYPNGFEVVTAGRTFYLAAGSAEDRQEWAEGIVNNVGLARAAGGGGGAPLSGSDRL
eukprot:SAG22_NODE_965_length_6268_cov_30.435403_5_plen_128_part_00